MTDFLYWDAEAIRARCVINGFPIRFMTADAIATLLWEIGVTDGFELR